MGTLCELALTTHGKSNYACACTSTTSATAEVSASDTASAVPGIFTPTLRLPRRVDIN